MTAERFLRRPIARGLRLLGALAAGAAGCEPAPGDPCREPGAICTVAGTGDRAFDGDGLPAAETAFYWPLDLDFAPDGRAYVLDWQNHRVRRWNADGRFETVVGTDYVGDGPADQSDVRPPGAPGTSVELNHPTDVSFLPDGSVLVAAWHNHKVRRLDPRTGLVTVVCGGGPGSAGDGGMATRATLNQPKSVAADREGNIFVTDSRSQRIRRVDAGSGIIETVAGTGRAGFGGDGGAPLEASFHIQRADENPEPGGGIALDGEGRLYVADTFNNRVRRIDLRRRIVETIAGSGEPGAGGDGGPAVAAALFRPRDVEIGPDGRLYIADTDNHRVRAVDLATGVIETVAGTGERGFGGDGGRARAARLARPFGVSFDQDGHLHVADTFNGRIRKIARERP